MTTEADNMSKLIALTSLDPEITKCVLDWIDLTNNGGWADQFMDEIREGVYDADLGAIANTISRRLAQAGSLPPTAYQPTSPGPIATLSQAWPLGTVFSYQDGRRTRISEGVYKVVGYYDQTTLIGEVLTPGSRNPGKTLRPGIKVRKMSPAFCVKVTPPAMCDTCGKYAVSRQGDECNDCRVASERAAAERREAEALAKIEAKERGEMERIRQLRENNSSANGKRRKPAAPVAPVAPAAPAPTSTSLRRRIRGIQRG